ncbi:hypothetical protein K3495_g8233 [Podosphaera aphanis]|nr:hypothetical protein K3495_g8233 [Podosphaera aphanis]
MSASKRIVVCGGNGFLGSRICKSAVAKGWEVKSISRSGEPKWASVTSSSIPPPWAHKVTWERADLLKPASYAPLLEKADCVVHSMGILIEADYKKIVSGQESPFSALKRAFSEKDSCQNPLARKNGDLFPPDSNGQLTYEIMNRDSATALAHEASKHRVPVFVYISAAGGAPILPQRYIKTKRDAESAISSDFPLIRSIFFRPGFLYDTSRSFTVPLAAMTGLSAAFNSITGGIFGGLMGAAGVKPLKADVVADAVVQAICENEAKGPVEVEEIENLAKKAWRKSML